MTDAPTSTPPIPTGRSWASSWVYPTAMVMVAAVIASQLSVIASLASGTEREMRVAALAGSGVPFAVDTPVVLRHVGPSIEATVIVAKGRHVMARSRNQRGEARPATVVALRVPQAGFLVVADATDDVPWFEGRTTTGRPITVDTVRSLDRLDASSLTVHVRPGGGVDVNDLGPVTPSTTPP